MEENQPKVGKKHRKKKVVGIVFLLLILLAGGLWFRFSPETLQKARKNPEAYGDLVVRIGGYSDYFVRLTPEMQEEIILRTAHGL